MRSATTEFYLATVSHSCSAHGAHCNDDQPVQRLDRLVPVTEDWHTQLTLMRVRLYSCNPIMIMMMYFKYTGN